MDKSKRRLDSKVLPAGYLLNEPGDNIRYRIWRTWVSALSDSNLRLLMGLVCDELEGRIAGDVPRRPSFGGDRDVGNVSRFERSCLGRD